MKKLSVPLLSVLVSLSVMIITLATRADDSQFAIVGTGGVTGVYYPTGGSICRMVNRMRSVHGIRCAVESTKGSIYNLTKVRERDLDLAVVQSDWHYHAVNGSGQFSELGPDEKLRSIFSLHAEPFTVVARKDSGIKSFGDLKGKRVNIGNIGSGQRATMEVLMARMAWDKAVFEQTFELKSADQAKGLCEGTFDAMIFVVGHPSGSIKDATTDCASTLVEVGGPVINKLIAEHDYYRTAIIPGGMYRGNDKDIATFGVGATFVTSADIADSVIYEVVKAVFENFEAFKALHPAFEHLEKAQMLQHGLAAPLHSGALKYYKEVGMR